MRPRGPKQCSRSEPSVIRAAQVERRLWVAMRLEGRDVNRPEAVVRSRLSVFSGSPQYAPCTRLRGVPATNASMLSISWSASACWASSAAHAMCGVMITLGDRPRAAAGCREAAARPRPRRSRRRRSVPRRAPRRAPTRRRGRRGGVEQQRPPLHRAELGPSDHVAGALRERRVQRDDVARFQHLLHGV